VVRKHKSNNLLGGIAQSKDAKTGGDKSRRGRGGRIFKGRFTKRICDIGFRLQTRKKKRSGRGVGKDTWGDKRKRAGEDVASKPWGTEFFEH